MSSEDASTKPEAIDQKPVIPPPAAMPSHSTPSTPTSAGKPATQSVVSIISLIWRPF